MMVSIAQYLNYTPTYNYHYLVGFGSVRAGWLSDLRTH